MEQILVFIEEHLTYFNDGPNCSRRRRSMRVLQGNNSSIESLDLRLFIDIVSDIIGLMRFLSSQLICASSIRIDYRLKIELMCHPRDKWMKIFNGECHLGSRIWESDDLWCGEKDVRVINLWFPYRSTRTNNQVWHWMWIKFTTMWIRREKNGLEQKMFSSIFKEDGRHVVYLMFKHM